MVWSLGLRNSESQTHANPFIRLERLRTQKMGILPLSTTFSGLCILYRRFFITTATTTITIYNQKGRKKGLPSHSRGVRGPSYQ